MTYADSAQAGRFWIVLLKKQNMPGFMIKSGGVYSSPETVLGGKLDA